MLDRNIIVGFQHHDQAINKLRAELRATQKTVDRAYSYSLTHVMMWDVLLTLLADRGIISQAQFNEALKALSDKAKASMEADQKKQAEEAAKGKVTVVSEVPAIPVVK